MNADWKTFQEPVVRLIFGIYFCQKNRLQKTSIQWTWVLSNKILREPEENVVFTFYGENGKSENQESFRTNFPHSILTNRKGSELMVVDMKSYPIDSKLPDIGDSLVRNPGLASVGLSGKCQEIPNNEKKKKKEIPNNEENQRENECASEASNNEKRVTFVGKHCIVAPKNVDGGHGSDDDQHSFRPSSFPLSHSSPSKISGTSL